MIVCVCLCVDQIREKEPLDWLRTKEYDVQRRAKIMTIFFHGVGSLPFCRFSQGRTTTVIVHMETNSVLSKTSKGFFINGLERCYFRVSMTFSWI